MSAGRGEGRGGEGRGGAWVIVQKGKSVHWSYIGRHVIQE